MKALFIVFISLISMVRAQVNSLENVKAIALQEQQRHQRMNGNNINGTTTLTGASANYDVKYYRCEWEVDPAIRFITGKVTVYYLISSATNSISFDLMSQLTADSVKQRNILLTKLHAANVLQVNFSSTVNAGTLDSLSIYYKGIPANTGFGSFIQDQHAGVPVMWSLSEPYGSRDWWPCKNGLDDKADSVDIIITNPVAYKAAANGIWQSETIIAGGTKKVTSWKHRYPIASYLICFAVTNYAVFNNTVQLGNITLPMQTYCYPESLAAFQAGTPNVLNALQLFHNNFGDYPFIKEKYGHVQFGWGGGMEHQTATFVVSSEEGLTAHELGHQWFGDKITCGSWEDIWLNEGFASHLASFYVENKYPASVLTNRKNEINFITSQPGGSVKVDDTTNVGRIFDSRLSYNKGSHLIYMLRFKLGDSVFFKAIRQYMKDPALAYGYARTTDLKRNLEQVSGQNLTNFFKQWFEGQGYPSYNVQWTPVGSSYVRIKMNQSTSHISVPFFEMPVALQFKNATQSKTIILDNKTNGEVFFKNIGFVADTVLIDPEYWLISRNNTTAKVPDVVNGNNIVQVYPNPIGNQFYVYLRGFISSSSATLAIYNTLGQKIYNRNITLMNGSEFLEIPSAQWPSGEYTLQIRSGTDFKLVKKLLK